MERMLIFCMLFFCSSMAMTAAPHKIATYKQLFKTITRLETTVKDKDVELLHTPENPVDGCLSTAVICFQKGALKLQPENSQVNSTFTQTIRVLGIPSDPISQAHCESSCESYEKKTPKEFLKSFANLIKQLIKN
ncbi:PREDICTED: interleukin-21 [Tauraco erythrolophus]|uniref:interleukin-21 n=1 Tax=Tauraco erythrolophus TaxID=121530 RepID=UPI000523E2B1|nr:PREDICTED: interleukin-21 [Tauraco erythrolophus]